jgi:hypothetical protein
MQWESVSSRQIQGCLLRTWRGDGLKPLAWPPSALIGAGGYRTLGGRSESALRASPAACPLLTRRFPRPIRETRHPR